MNNRCLAWFLALLLLASVAQPALADPPIASYVFPAGEQRETTVEVRVGGLNLNSKASFEMLGAGVKASPEVRRVETIWFEGPLLPLPDSQQPEDYPKDYSGRVSIAADAATGPRAWRIWNSQGASGSLPFVVGDLPEIVERESDASPQPQSVTLPVTINGRIFPREDVDLWSFPLRAGEVLDPWFEAIDDQGLRLADSAPAPARSCDGRLAFVAPGDGTYMIKIHDVNVKGGQNHIYRLSLTTGPSIATVFPLGGRRGSSVSFARDGLGLAGTIDPITLPTEGDGSGPATAQVRFADGGSMAVEVDDLPEAMEVEPNDTMDQASRLSTPGVANGRIQQAGDRDLWMVPLRRGQAYRIDLRAVRLGSRLDALLSILDAKGNELAHAEGTAGRGGDPGLTFQPTTDGPHFLQIKDRFRSRGGASWAYRLRVHEAPPDDFRLFVAADTLSVPRGGSAKLKVEVERLGAFLGPVALGVEGLPEGVSVAETSIGPKANAAELTFKTEASAPIRSSRLTIRGKAEIGGTARERTTTRSAMIGLPEIDSIRFTVGLPTPFEIGGPVDYDWVPRGTVRRRHYKLARNGFAGPIEIRLADRQARHLQGVTGPEVTIPEGTDGFDYPVSLPPSMEIGRTSRTVVMATGVVRESDGTEHEVSFSNQKAEIQVVAVIGPGRLGLEVGRASVAVAPGRTLEIPVKIARGKGLEVPVRVEIVPSPMLRGLSAEPLIVNTDREEATLEIKCGPDIGRFETGRVLLRATALVGGDPVTAQASLTIVPDALLRSGK
jgi:hypothetical protein